MSYICDNCGKTAISGRSQRHGRGVAGKRWKKRAQMTVKVFKPNLQKITVVVSGKRMSLKLCAKCLKKFRGKGKLQSFPNAILG